jgi:hypothetical protein
MKSYSRLSRTGPTIENQTGRDALRTSHWLYAWTGRVHPFASFAHPQRFQRSERSSPLNQVNDQDNDRNHEQQMDQRAANMAEKPEKPENNENHKYSPQHRFDFRLISSQVLCATLQQKDQKQNRNGNPKKPKQDVPSRTGLFDSIC